MSITVLKSSRTVAGLQEDGPVARPLGQPVATTRDLPVVLAGAGDNRTGVWECSPGRFERQLAESEVMHILSGRCVFTPTGGEPVQIDAGDTLFFPAHTTGVWEIQETLRKVYVVMALPSAAA